MYSRAYNFDWWIRSLARHCENIERWKAIEGFLTGWCELLGYKDTPAACYHHGAFKGGLIDHMSRVMDIALRVASVTFPSLPLDSVALCAGFHDISKLGMVINGVPVPRYLPNDKFDPKAEVNRKNAPYLINKELDGLSMTLQNSGIAWAWLPLSLAEWKAISFHDGMYVPENERVFRTHNAEPLLLLIHFADIIALQYETDRPGDLNVAKMLGRP